MDIELPLEHQRHNIRGTARLLCAGFAYFGEPRIVMLAQLRNPRAHAAKRLAMRRQHQRVLGHRLVAAERFQIQRERVPSGSISNTETLVEIRGNTMSPEISTPSA